MGLLDGYAFGPRESRGRPRKNKPEEVMKAPVNSKSRNDIYGLKTLKQHFVDLTAADFIEAVYGLGKEGKNLLNVLNQIKIAKELCGKFVGDTVDSWDIEIAEIFKIELKCNTSVAQGTYAKKVGFGSWVQKENWTHLIHYLPHSFVDFIDEDKFIVFTWADREKMLEYTDSNGNLNFSSSIYIKGHVPNRRNKEKMLFLQERIHTLEELKALFGCQ